MLKKAVSAVSFAAVCALSTQALAGYQNSYHDTDEYQNENNEETFELEDIDDIWKGKRSSNYNARSFGHSSWGEMRAKRHQKRAAWRLKRWATDTIEEYDDLDGEIDPDVAQWWASWFDEKQIRDWKKRRPIKGGKHYNDPKSPPVSEVPIPGALVLFGSALGLMGISRNRKTR